MGRPDVPSDIEPRRVEVAGGLASYTDEGAGPVVLAVHGLPGSGRDFRWLAPALSERFRVIRVDLPGFGGTPLSARPGFAPEDRAAFVLEVADALELERPLLLGHSMGGVVAVAAAVEAPKRFAGVGLIAAPGLRPHRAFRRLPRRLLSGWLASPGRARVAMPAIRSFFRSAGFRAAYPDEALVNTLHGVAAVSFEAHAARLEVLRAPTMVVWCDDDPLIEPEIQEELVRSVPLGPRLRFDEGGHNPQKHHAVEIAEAIARWPAAQTFRVPRSPGGGLPSLQRKLRAP